MFPIYPVEEIASLVSDPRRLVVVEESPEYPGQLLWQTIDDVNFLARYRDWISRYLCSNELYMVTEFVKQLQEDGWEVFFTPSTKAILNDYERWDRPLEVAGFTCPGEGELYPFQRFTLNRALERAGGSQDRLTFFGWCTGSGKSLAACAGAQELFNRDEIDVCLVFTLMSMKRNLASAATASFAKTTTLDWCLPEGSKPTRIRRYKERHQVYILNYERMWADYQWIKELIAGRRVLWVLDETQKLLTGEQEARRRTKTRKHFDRLVAGCHAIVWPMSASVVSDNPLRYRDVYNLAGEESHNPLGTIKDFTRRYSTEIRTMPLTRYEEVTYYEWNLGRLHEVRHRVAPRTQSARKTDPGVREFFKGNTQEIIPIQMSPEDRRIYDAILDDAYRARKEGDRLIGYYRLLRYVCNTPLALSASVDEKAADYCAQHPKLITNAHSAKLAFFLDQLESIAGEGGKVLAFTKWTNLSLLLLAPELTKRGINHVLHYGTGQKQVDSQAAQHQFKTDPAITVFFSSDAGAYGLNMPEARYNISYECPYSYDLLMQRSERNNRADSTFDTQTYVYITENTVEERILQINDERRQLAQATLGTVETLSYGSTRATRSEEANMNFLLWGEE